MNNDIGLFKLLNARMGWLGDRQRLVAENVANASTPGFKPRDLTAMNFENALRGESSGVEVTRTNALHIEGQQIGHVGSKPVVSPDSETTMDGNAVVLEEQMLRMAETRMQFEAAIGFYHKSMNLLRQASRRPGG